MNTIQLKTKGNVNSETRELYRPLCREVMAALTEYYGTNILKRAVARGFVEGVMPLVLSQCPQEYQGATVLDLGCGAVDGMDSQLVNFEPWLCRALHSVGVDVIGIDIQRSVLRERFRAYSIDLMCDDALSFLPDRSVDVAHAHMFFDEPMLRSAYGGGAGLKLYQKILPQLERIVKPEGCFIYDHNFV